MSLASLALPRWTVPDWAPVAGGLADPAAARIGAGRLGDARATARYTARANRLAGASALGGAVLATAALAGHPGLWAGVACLALGGFCDWARGRLPCLLRIDGDCVVVESGAWRGLRLVRRQLEAVGFGAPARAPGRGPPETFWTGDFGERARSHLVVVRVVRGPGRPRRLLIAEPGIAEAQAAADRLRRWCGE